MSDQKSDAMRALRERIATFPLRVHVQMPTRLLPASEGDDPPEDRPQTPEEAAHIQKIRKAMNIELQKLMGTIRRQLPLATLVTSNAMTTGEEIVEVDFDDAAYSALPRAAVEGTRRRVAHLVSSRLADLRTSIIAEEGSGTPPSSREAPDRSARERAQRLFGSMTAARRVQFRDEDAL